MIAVRPGPWIAGIALFLLQTSLFADVFSLFPFRTGSAAPSGVENALHGSRLWTEEVELNGRKLELEVSLVDRTMEEALRDLRGQFRKGAAAMNSNSLLFEVPLESGARKRYYLVSLKGMIPTLQFSLTLPRGFRNAPGAWHPDLPLPPGAMPLSLMRFPKRNSVYGSFRSPFPARQTLTDLVRSLQNANWKSMGKENPSSPQASGEIFLQEKKQLILIVSVQDSPAGGGSTGSLYLRKLEK